MVLALARAHQLHHVVDGIMIRKSESERSHAEKWKLEHSLGQELPRTASSSRTTLTFLRTHLQGPFSRLHISHISTLGTKPRVPESSETNSNQTIVLP